MAGACRIRFTVALDTATDVATVAVGADGQVLAEVRLPGRRHASALLPGLDEVVRVAGGQLADIGRVLCADGPGSFTGLRIGFATVQALVRANDHITVGTAPSLLAMAWAAAPWCSGPVAALYDALRGDVFGAVYEMNDNGVDVLLPPTLLTVEELTRRSPVRPALVVGSGAMADAARITDWSGRPPVGPPAAEPRAAALLALDGTRGGVRSIADIVTFEPDYGRPAEAQARWERMHGTSLPDSGGAFR